MQRVYHPDYNNELTQFLPRIVTLKKPPGAQVSLWNNCLLFQARFVHTRPRSWPWLGEMNWEADKKVKKLPFMSRKAEMPLPQLLTAL